MAKIVTIAQQKGGAGKTALAAQLGVAFAEMGLRVALIDSDPQRSLSAWHRIRCHEPQNPGFDFASVEGWKAAGEAERLARSADIVLVDTAPHAETAARTAVRSADLVLVPLQPSPIDLWATEASLKLIAGERRDFMLVLNRVPPRGRLVDDMLVMLDAHPRAQATLGNRQAFATSMATGQGVVETEPRSKAAAEIRELAAELRQRLALGAVFV